MASFTESDILNMANHYAKTMLWTSTDDNDEPMDDNYDADDITDAAFDAMRKDCENFATLVGADLDNIDSGQAGHDFALTRNRHGAGFWDRGLGDLGDRLTRQAHTFGEQNLIVGDDNKIHVA